MSECVCVCSIYTFIHTHVWVCVCVWVGRWDPLKKREKILFCPLASKQQHFCLNEHFRTSWCVAKKKTNDASSPLGSSVCWTEKISPDYTHSLKAMASRSSSSSTKSFLRRKWRKMKRLLTKEKTGKKFAYSAKNHLFSFHRSIDFGEFWPLKRIAAAQLKIWSSICINMDGGTAANSALIMLHSFSSLIKARFEMRRNRN